MSAYSIKCEINCLLGLKLVYFAFVHPHLLYGIEMYANTGSTHLNKLETLNNKLLSILQNEPYNYPTRDLYVKYNTSSIPDLHKYQILLLVHRMPSVFSNYFELNKKFNVHSHDTRISKDLLSPQLTKI